jgi:hypothetical protein
MRAVHTIDMVHGESLKDRAMIDWLAFRKRCSYRHDAAMAGDAHNLSKHTAKAPNLYDGRL